MQLEMLLCREIDQVRLCAKRLPTCHVSFRKPGLSEFQKLLVLRRRDRSEGRESMRAPASLVYGCLWQQAMQATCAVNNVPRDGVAHGVAALPLLPDHRPQKSPLSIGRFWI